MLDYIELDESKSRLSMRALDEQLEKEPKIVAVTHASNVLGTINDVKSITREAHKPAQWCLSMARSRRRT